MNFSETLDRGVIIIAEAGVNHNGELSKAKALVDVAAEAGADYVKFQTFKAEKLVSKEAKQAAYQAQNLKSGNASQLDMLKKLEMPEHWHYDLMAYADSKNVKFLSTGFDESSIDFLDELGMTFYKIPSGEITNKPYLEHIAKKGKPVIISTGMATLEEIRAALTIFQSAGVSNSNLVVLHCNTEYPTPFEDVNLLAMKTIENEFGIKVGYSDHTLGIEVPVAAVALGARVIEKHFTLDRTLSGPDHAASLEPQELSAMVSAIRNTSLAISGSGKKEPSDSEKKNKSAARKSIHLIHPLSKGELIQRSNLEMKRPGDGISPMDMDEVICKKAQTDLPAGHLLNEKDFF